MGGPAGCAAGRGGGNRYWTGAPGTAVRSEPDDCNLAVAFDKGQYRFLLGDISFSHRHGSTNSRPTPMPRTPPVLVPAGKPGQGCAGALPARMRRNRGGVLHAVPASCFVPFRSHCLRLAEGPCFARIAGGRAPVSAGAVRAPDCARARGKRRAHLSCRPPPGLAAPVAAPCPKKKRAAPVAALLPVPILTQIFRTQAPAGRFVKIFRNPCFGARRPPADHPFAQASAQARASSR